ncbi:hypothetical protein I4U23_015984 [Adineta vaga]|nr:hypothetical protein I4U23_015984 [Adineta vaga]
MELEIQESTDGNQNMRTRLYFILLFITISILILYTSLIYRTDQITVETTNTRFSHIDGYVEKCLYDQECIEQISYYIHSLFLPKLLIQTQSKYSIIRSINSKTN